MKAAAEPSAPAVARRSTRGALWLTIATGMQGFAGLIASLILARILGPGPYGTYAIGSAIVDVAGLVLRWGFGVALVQDRDEQESDADRLLDTAITLSCGLGATFVVLVILAGGLAQDRMPAGVAVLLPWLAVRTALTLPSACYSASLQRRLRFGSMAVAGAIGTIAGEALAILIALQGGGAWALLVRDTVATALGLLVLWLLSGRRIAVAWHRPSMALLLGTGGGVLAINVLDTLQGRLDRLLIGLTRGSVATGLYSEASGLAGDSDRAFAPVLAQVGLGAYARLQGQPTRLADAFQLVQMMLVRAGLVPVVALVVAPEALLRFLYGDRWVQAAPTLRLLALLALALPLYDHARSLLYAANDVAAAVRARVVQFVVFLPALAVGVWLWGMQGAALAVDLAMAAALLALGVAIVRHLGRPGVASLLRLLRVVGVAIVAVVVGMLLPSLGTSRPAEAFALTAPVSIYVLALILAERSDLWHDTARVLKAFWDRSVQRRTDGLIVPDLAHGPEPAVVPSGDGS